MLRALLAAFLLTLPLAAEQAKELPLVFEEDFEKGADRWVEGCVALRPRGEHDCELKRLYVRPARRGSGAGRLLSERVIADAREIGYERVLLDTLDSMKAAQRLYESLGFVDAAPYTHNPLAGVRYMQLDLRSEPRPNAHSGA